MEAYRSTNGSRLDMAGALCVGVMTIVSIAGCNGGNRNPASAPPAITRFVVDTTPINPGMTVGLEGDFSNGSGVIMPGSLPVSSGVPVTVSPGTTTSYTLTVTNAAGKSVAQTIDVSVAELGAASLAVFAGLPSKSGNADGPGLEARFKMPSGLAMDGAGDLFLADSDNRTIRKITADGVTSTLAGSADTRGGADGSGAAASFSYPWGVALDQSGNLYVADCGNATVRKISPAGEVSTLAGKAGVEGSVDGVGAEARFVSPTGVAVDASGNVYVADKYDSTIRKINPAGEVSTLAGRSNHPGTSDGRGADALFMTPMGLAVDRSGNLFVTDEETIRKITPAGEVSTLAGLSGAKGHVDGLAAAARFSGLLGLAVDGPGNVYVGDRGSHSLRKLSPAGVVSTVVIVPPSCIAPTFVAVDPVTGKLFLTVAEAVAKVELKP